MNPEIHPEASGEDPTGPGFSIDDAYYILFRRKWLLLLFTFLGIAAATAVWFIRPPRYESRAKLMVQYIADTKVNPGNVENIKQLDYGADSLIKTEVEIIYSLDVAAEVVDEITPEKILAKKGGGNDRLSAAGVVRSGIEVEPPRSSVVTIIYRHPDKDVVQPVLRALIEKYMDKHREVHRGGAEKEAYFAKQRDELRVKLEATEEELKNYLLLSKGMSVSDAKKTYMGQIETLMIELQKTQADLAEARAISGDLTMEPAADPNTDLTSVPPEKIENYHLVANELERLRKRESAFLAQDYSPQHPQMTNVQWQIKNLIERRSALEKEYPALIAFRPMLGASTNSSGVDLAAELGRVKGLTARVETLGIQLTNLQAEAATIVALEPIIGRLQRDLEQYEKEYRYYINTLDESRMGDNGGNMSIVQHPTPPALDQKKALKLAGAAFCGFAGLGLGLAILLDFIIDRTIKRSIEVERHLRLPLLISIPDARWRQRGHNGRRRHHRSSRHHNAVVRWDSRQSIAPYANGLRERLITYFEGNGSSQNKPKRVAVTSCAHGAGVTTIATSLASSLSRIPGVSVLLVDMNIGHGVARTFRNGEPTVHQEFAANGIPEGDDSATEEKSHEEESEMTAENAAVVPMRDGLNGEFNEALPTGLAHLAPQFEANDHDFVIFDLPPASQTSMTPRLAGYMDIVLLVLESEKTSRQLAGHASKLMQNSRANVAAVLNKYRKYVPDQLSQEF